MTLAPGATYTGNFVLPAVEGTAAVYITVRTADDGGTFPRPGQRIVPAHSDRLAKLKSPNGDPALRTAAGAHHWRLQLLEFLPTASAAADIIRLGDGSAAQRDRLAGAARPRNRALLHPRRSRPWTEAWHRAEQRRNHHRRLLHLRHQGEWPGFPGHRRLERARSVHHREQLPRRCRRQLPAGGIRSGDSGACHGGRGVPPQPARQTGRLARAGLAGQEHLRTEERAAGPGRRQRDGVRVA